MTADTRIAQNDAGLPEDPDLFKVLSEIDMIAHMAAVAFERLLPDGLTRAQFGVLNRLTRLGTEETVGELAEAFQVTQPTMSSTIRRLEDKGLITLAPDPSDRRIKRARLTSQGEAMRDKTIALLAPYTETLQRTAPQTDWAQLVETLKSIRLYFEETRVP